MPNLQKLFVVSVLMVATLSGCDDISTPKDNAITDNATTDNTTIDNSTIEDDIAKSEDFGNVMFSYKGAYVGDNSAVGNMLYHLDMTFDDHIYVDKIQLITDKPPYGIIINNKWLESEDTPTEQRVRQKSAYYATYLFVLIRNVDFITFNSNQGSHTITKEAMIEWYGRDFTTIENNEALEEFIRNNFNSEKVDALFIDDTF